MRQDLGTIGPKEAKLNIRVQIVVLSVGLLILVAKFMAYFITNSNAILTDAAESIINVVAGALGLYSLILSAKPKDRNHPYGHGKIEFISASIEGFLIAAAGITIIVKSIYNLIYPIDIQSMDIGLYITIGGGILNFLMGFVTVKVGPRNQSMALKASGEHLKSDAYSTAGLIIGLILIIATGYVWLDSVVAIIFGAVILFAGYRIIRSSIGGIMDEADYDLHRKIIRIMDENRRQPWVDVHNMRVIKYGSQLHVDCHVTLPWYYNVDQAHDEIDMIDEMINKHVPNNVEFFIHVDPCIPSCCPHCIKEDCEVRQHPFEKRIPWSLSTAMQPEKHNLRDYEP
jgi:cation diffusion facilitator family transporter